MAFTVFIYKDGNVHDQKNFDNVQLAHNYIGELDLKTDVEMVILDDGTEILSKLKRDENGNLSSVAIES